MKQLPSSIGALVLDFDGVFTDNRVLVSEDGKESVMCHRGDGLGLTLLKKTGTPIMVLSLEKNPVVKARCRKLGLFVQQGIEDKLSVLKGWLTKNKIRIEDVVYLGNDLNDVACLRAVGCGVVVADAVPNAKAAAQIVLSKPGGYGAIRELCDLILKQLKGFRLP